ncbi:prephenate dehydrogenase [Clostridium cavendishii DSM 21758]|uniref:Prephenate dehydrogenase n=1 Tax=Clostridium cavendishii DSM 21758 TaxID=1121302 RepID=A0A1M6MXP6_9CLOT|nr:prephenate dehydrogenase [Clostridium cavendishii]SHJ88247.1 prephenate dehydrogenase [Clostridium cavendishii DSM 21758]
MNITIVGLGVIGGSYALALKPLKKYRLFAIDKDEDTLRKAEKLGIIEKGYSLEDNVEEVIKNSDIIIISIYPSLVKSFIENNKAYFAKGTVITDATGVKGLFAQEIIKILPDGVDFIFAHPMAGREKKGLDYASAEVFKGANFIITPIDNNAISNLKLIENLAYEMGFSNVKYLGLKEHDNIIAYTSQLPHVLAVSLINSEALNEDTGKCIGDSYRDLTRIANINAELWSELFLGNKENLLKNIYAFEHEMKTIKEALIRDDKASLEEIFKKSTSRREKL